MAAVLMDPVGGQAGSMFFAIASDAIDQGSGQLGEVCESFMDDNGFRRSVSGRAAGGGAWPGRVCPALGERKHRVYR